jgi:NADP-dependent 3-hydroxy acid dehydrogenase YdfG
VVVVITGASGGIGRATALQFAAEGAKVVLIARGRDGLQALRGRSSGPTLGGRSQLELRRAA